VSSSLQHPSRSRCGLGGLCVNHSSARHPPWRGRMPHPRKWSPWLARDYRKHWHFRLFSAFQTPRGRAARATTEHPPSSPFPCPRSGFHGFQCWPSSRAPADPFVSFLSFCAKSSPSKPSASPRLCVSSFLPLSIRWGATWKSHLPGGARDYGKQWSFRLFSAFQTPRGRAARAPTAQPLPSLFPLCRSSVRLGLKPPFIRIE
jgi:hypothetical protein